MLGELTAYPTIPFPPQVNNHHIPGYKLEPSLLEE